MDVEEKRGLKKHDGCWVRKSNTYNVLLELLVFPLLPKKKLMQLIFLLFSIACSVGANYTLATAAAW